MELMEAPRSGLSPAIPLDPSGDPEAARAGDTEGANARRQTQPYSFAAECECPDDCLRDHANE